MIIVTSPIFVLKIIKLVFPPLTLRYVCAHSERKHPDNQATKKTKPLGSAACAARTKQLKY